MPKKVLSTERGGAATPTGTGTRRRGKAKCTPRPLACRHTGVRQRDHGQRVKG